ncbi:MAG: hypothetical protein ACI4ON_01785 [Clostridia bacterium]
MFYQNYYPYNMNYNYKNNYNKGFNNFNHNYYNSNNEKKDIDSPKSETIPFQEYKQCNNTQNFNSSIPNKEFNNDDNAKKFNLLGFSFEIDDLIIIGLIILLFLESDKNYALIIILGLILLNVNLSDILNIF